MTGTKAPIPIRTADYEAIEAALIESARGRWFLAEFARRNRTADTQILLEAITKLETAIIRPREERGADLIRRDLIEMSEAISRTRQEIAAIKPPERDDSQLIAATEELDAIVASTETATSDILEAAEDIQEVAWALREAGTDDGTCDRLDQRAIDIYTACSFQDITGQRTQKVVQALRFLESRVNSMIEIWGIKEIAPQPLVCEEARPDAHLLNGPQLDGCGLDQADIDNMIAVPDDEIEVIEASPEFDPPEPAPAAEAAAVAPMPERPAERTAAPVADETPSPTAAPTDDAPCHPPAAPVPETAEASALPPEVVSAQDVTSTESAAPDPVAPEAAPPSGDGAAPAANFVEPTDLDFETLDQDQRSALFS